MKLKPKYIIWDDYGNEEFFGVKKYVDEFVKDKYKLIPIGLSDGEFFKANGKIVDSEGVMIKV